MGKLVVVQGDGVQGTDKHNVTGIGPTPPGLQFAGTGTYQYSGNMTDSLSNFVTIAGKPVAVVTSKSSLGPGQTVPPIGGHSGPAGIAFTPGPGSPAPQPNPATVMIADVIGTGVPNVAAGSALLTIGGTKVLLDGDKIDTCDGTGGTANSTVTAVGQSFVSCSG
jgi:hypothetical protein